MFPPLFGLSSGYQHGAREAWAVSVLKSVLAKRAVANKEAAALQGLSGQQWSLQLSCRNGAHISFQRLIGRLPLPVLRDLWVALLEEHRDVLVVEDQRLQRAVEANIRLAEAIDARTQTQTRLNFEAADSDRVSA